MSFLLSYGYYGGYDGLRFNFSLSGYLFAAIAVMVLGIIAQARVSSVYNKFSQVPVSCGRTASSIANELLRQNGSSVTVKQIAGSLTDNYNPKAGCVSLSQSVYNSATIAAVAVAARISASIVIVLFRHEMHMLFPLPQNPGRSSCPATVTLRPLESEASLVSYTTNFTEPKRRASSSRM